MGEWADLPWEEKVAGIFIFFLPLILFAAGAFMLVMEVLR